MLLLLAAPAVLLHLYVGWKLSSAIAVVAGVPKWRIRKNVFLLQGYLVLYPILGILGYLVNPAYLSRALEGLYRGPDVLFAYPYWIGLIVVLESAPFLLAADLVRLFVRLMRVSREKWVRYESRTTLVVVAVVAAYVIVRVFVDTFGIRISSHDLSMENLPAGLDGVRIVQIADLQMDPRTGPSTVKRFVEEVNDLDPDIVFFCGDLITSGTDYIDQAAEILGMVKSRYGIYAVLGDHDYWSGAGVVEYALTRNGVRLLDDENFVLNFKGQTIVVTGVTNVYPRRVSTEVLQKLAAGRVPNALSIFFTHQPTPSTVSYAEREGYRLFLAGHTHGGQVRLGYDGLKWTFSNLETPYVSGFYRVGRMIVNVDNGLGLTLAPLRFQAPAEITVIKLIRGGVGRASHPGETHSDRF
ncbi:MAG TPA: metallophosphoesterase [Bacteroidota bacterium]